MKKFIAASILSAMLASCSNSVQYRYDVKFEKCSGAKGEWSYVGDKNELPELYSPPSGRSLGVPIVTNHNQFGGEPKMWTMNVCDFTYMRTLVK